MLMITFRTRRTFRSIQFKRALREVGTDGQTGFFRHVGPSKTNKTGRVWSMPGILYCALYGGHGAAPALTINGRDFGPRIIPSR